MRLIPTGTPLIILRGPLRGYKLIMGAPAGSGKGLSIIINRSEPKRMRLAKDLALPNFICFDIGANVGIYSLLFATKSKFVYAFEPLPRNLKYLCKTINLNKVENIKIIPYAVTNKVGISWFQEGENVAEGKLGPNGALRVKTISLDNFIKNKGVEPNLLKIDVEGAEISVLEGAKNYMIQKKPILLIETHGDTLKKKVFKFLNEIGYKKVIPIDSESIEEANDFVFKT
ncbi:MAG: FkbM family methyltransferase [Promethearchaeota archaeon]